MLKRSKFQSQNAEITLHNLCVKLNLNKNVIQYIKNDYNNHYNHESLEAISDSLLRNGVPNKAIKINKNRIHELPVPAILFFRTERKFVLLESISSNIVTVIDSIKGKTQFNIEEILKYWDGTTLLISNKIIDIKKETKKPSFNYSLINIALPILLVFFLIFNNSSINIENKAYFILLEFLSLIGIYFSIILMKVEQYEIADSFVKLCYISKKFDCFSVAHSKISKFLKVISLAELSLVFFVSMSIIYIIAFSFKIVFVNFNTILLLCILPFTLFSIVAQLRYIKKWCLFCLIIDAILWIKFIVLLPYLKKPDHFYLVDIINYMVIFTISFNLLFLVKWVIKLRSNLKTSENITNQLTCSFEVIESLFNKEPDINTKITKDDITIGNIDSNESILFILNPYCQHCSKVLSELILINELFKLKIIIRILPLKKSIKEAQFIKLLYIQNKILGSKHVTDILRKVFTYKGNLEKYIDNYIHSLQHHLNRGEDKFEVYDENINWFEENNIRNAPLIIINGKLFPRNLPLKSLFYYLKGYSTKTLTK